jgi:hypothetical protein
LEPFQLPADLLKTSFNFFLVHALFIIF